MRCPEANNKILCKKAQTKLVRYIGWRSQLEEDRKIIGDFACYIVDLIKWFSF